MRYGDDPYLDKNSKHTNSKMTLQLSKQKSNVSNARKSIINKQLLISQQMSEQSHTTDKTKHSVYSTSPTNSQKEKRDKLIDATKNFPQRAEHLPMLKELEPSLKHEVQGYVKAHLREVKEKAKRKYAFRVIGSLKDEKMIMEMY